MHYDIAEHTACLELFPFSHSVHPQLLLGIILLNYYNYYELLSCSVSHYVSRPLTVNEY